MKTIILEIDKNGDTHTITDDRFNNFIPPHPVYGGKTIKQLVQDDIINGTDKTGHAKYRKILKDAGLITDLELSTWRTKLSITEKEAPSLTP